MNDPERMGFGHALARLQEVHRGIVERERTTLGHAPEVLALEELHDHVGRPVREPPDVGHLGDVLAAQEDRGARFAHEAGDLLFVVAQEDLDGDREVQLEVARLHDPADAALPDLALDPVLSVDDVADGHRFSVREGHAVCAREHRPKHIPTDALRTRLSAL